jgi:hypothetical protein
MYIFPKNYYSFLFILKLLASMYVRVEGECCNLRIISKIWKAVNTQNSHEEYKFK